MEQIVVMALLNNAALLLVLSVIYEVTYFIPSRLRQYRPYFSGLMIAGICVAIMSVPFTIQPGIVYDTRSILISVTGLIFGPIPTLITVIAAATHRIINGGAGLLPGLAVIISSALIGLAWRHWIYPRFNKAKWLSVYIMSILVHAVMIALMLLLPYPTNLNIIRNITAPVMVIYPIATVLLNLLLLRQQEMRRTQEELKRSEEKYRQITENVTDVVWTADLNLKTTFISPSVERLLGEKSEDHLKRSLEEKLPPVSLEKIGVILADELSNDESREKARTRVVELEHYHANGSIIWISMNISILRDQAGEPVGFLGVSRDITMLKEAQEELQYRIDHDDLTGLFNRRYYEHEVKRLDSADELPLSIVIVDINGLKLINDSFGLVEGDKIITSSANIIRSCCDDNCILARTGGDEFSILLPNKDSNAAIELIHSIQTACDLHNTEESNEAFHISLAFGTETKKELNDDFVQVHKRAEDFLRQSKLLKKTSANSEIIASIRATMQEKSLETEEHSERLAQLAKKIGSKLNLSQVELDHIELLATLHDIGKVGIPESILKKPGKLTQDEWKEMKKHPEIGYRIAMSSHNLAPISSYILCHHERWDGNGYPQGLKENEIPLLSRIISIVDAYDAMTADRVYRKAMSHEDALEEIKQCSGTQFDPDLVEIFTEIVE